MTYSAIQRVVKEELSGDGEKRPRSHAARFRRYLREHDPSTEVMSAAVSLLVWKWLVFWPPSPATYSVTHTALTTHFPQWFWLAYSGAAFVLTVAGRLWRSPALRILGAFFHVGLFALLALEIWTLAGPNTVAGDVFAVFIFGAAYTVAKLAARYAP